jgi:hypothetical protein
MKKLIFILLLILSTSYSQTKWFDEEFTHCIVLLEKEADGVLVPHGTGFLIYSYDKPTERFVITCEHILRNRFIYVKIPADTFIINTLRKERFPILNYEGDKWILSGKNLFQKIGLKKDTTFFVNKELDIGIFKINIPSYIFDADSTKQYITSIKGIPKSHISKRSDVKLGDEIYFLGFPYSIGTEFGWVMQGKYAEEISNPLLRTGTIAYISENINEFLIDAFSYSGNSGSPIFSRQGLSNTKSKLVGMIVGHLPSEESDNIGLARAVWIDDIVELLEEFKSND